MADSDQIDLELQPEEVPHTGTLAVGELERLAAVLGLPFQSSISNVNPPRNPPHGEFSRLIGSWGKQSHVVPVGEQDGVLVVATSDPLNTQALDAVRYCYNLPLHVVVTSETEVVRAMNSVRTTLMSDRSSALEAGEKDRGDDILQTLKIDVTDAEDDDAPIIRYVNTLIFRAASQRASDIHIEPFEDCLKVRFRIDGVLQDVDTEETAFQAAILSRIKVMANLDIAEKRLPQDGRIGIRIAGQDVDIRVSTVPTRYGERIVMRLLDKSKVLIDLGSLGLSKRNLGAVERTIVKSHGIVLVTGPTGSGKTTSLYAFLSTINAPDKNILTVEDPVEYELKGIGQMQVNPKINFTFSTGLRSILRQDPDVIMIGEIRDLETVEIAIQASLTGHLVFSTLHTNDAPGAITRMLDMGVEPFLISSSLLCVMAQRLVRTLCPNCRVPHQLTQIEARELGLDFATASRNPVFKARDAGCEFCQRTGYRGRMGIHEMLMIDDDIRSKIMARADSTTIRAASREMRSLRWDGAEKVLAGLTSVEEVLRVTQEDLIDVG